MSQKLDGVRPILWFPLVHVSYFLHLRFSRWTERNPYYEILRVRQQYAQENYGGQNDLGKFQKQYSCEFQWQISIMSNVLQNGQCALDRRVQDLGILRISKQSLEWETYHAMVVGLGGHLLHLVASCCSKWRGPWTMGIFDALHLGEVQDNPKITDATSSSDIIR